MGNILPAPYRIKGTSCSCGQSVSFLPSHIFMKPWPCGFPPGWQGRGHVGSPASSLGFVPSAPGSSSPPKGTTPDLGLQLLLYIPGPNSHGPERRVLPLHKRGPPTGVRCSLLSVPPPRAFLIVLSLTQSHSCGSWVPHYSALHLVHFWGLHQSLGHPSEKDGRVLTFPEPQTAPDTLHCEFQAGSLESGWKLQDPPGPG